MPYRWSLWTRQLIVVGAANGVTYPAMARALGTTSRAVGGVVFRSRTPYAQRRVPKRFYKDALYVMVDPGMMAEIRAAQAGRTIATTVRELIEWGLEAHHNG